MAGSVPTLRTWASLLSFLDSDLAAAVEGMARRLDIAMSAPSHELSDGDAPDGYDGIDRRGDLEHLLLSEWLLAEEEPLEFVRKFAGSELAYLHREHVDPQSPRRLVVLADTGPGQLGARRLVHLAGLAVLARRAEAQGVPLCLGLTGDEPGTFHEGELPELFTLWLRGRSTDELDDDRLNEWRASLEVDDRGWLFGGSGVRVQDRRLRHLRATELEWTGGGPAALEAFVDERPLRLALPGPADAVRLLRGQGIRRVAPPSVERTTRVRFPRFTDHTRRLICRGPSPDELISIKIPRPGSGAAAGTRKHRFCGPVLAAASLDARIVALVWVDGSLRVEVHGRRISDLDEIDVMPSELGLRAASMEELIESTLTTLLYRSPGQLLLRLGRTWWTIAAPSSARRTGIVAAAPARQLDQPRLAALGPHGSSAGRGLYIDGRPVTDAAPDGPVLFGPRGHVAYEIKLGLYGLIGPGSWGRIHFDSSQALGLVVIGGGEPQLVVKSNGNRILRLVGPEPSRPRTLLNASGDILDVAVHPLDPLIAVQRQDGTIEAFDLPDGSPTVFLMPDTP